MPAPKKFTKQKQQDFLERLKETANVTLAAKSCGVTPRTAYRYKGEDEAFSLEWDCAIDEALDLVEEEVRRRAVDGVEKPVFYQGEQCGAIREYSDTLLMFMLKAHRPEKYRERSSVQVTGKGDGPVQVDVAHDVKKLANEELFVLGKLMDVMDGSLDILGKKWDKYVWQSHIKKFEDLVEYYKGLPVQFIQDH